MRSILILVLAVCAAAPATAGTIRGHAGVPATPHRDLHFHPYAGRAASLAAPAPQPHGRVTDAVVYVEAVPAGGGSLAHARPRLAQRGQTFDPRVVVVAAGGEVEFPNFDPVYHNVFSVSPARRFDLGKYPRGQSRTVRFDKPGLVRVFCDIHSDMSAFILVTPNAAWARPDSAGRFELPPLSAGRYRVHWWHPDFAPGERELEVSADGTVNLDLEFQ